MDERPTGTLVGLVVVGCLVAATLALGVVLFTRGTPQLAARADSAVEEPTTTTTGPPPTTSTTLPLASGEIRFLSTQSSIIASDYWIDLSAMDVGTCFVVNMRSASHPVAVETDCATEHFYQLYAVGFIPTEITEYTEVSAFWADLCDKSFAPFVGVEYIDSAFYATWREPLPYESPGNRWATCYLYLPGEQGWMGDAEGSEQ